MTQANPTLRIAYYISGHGFGHSTRAYAVIAQLLEKGHVVSISTSAPQFIFEDLLANPSCTFRNVFIESEVAQKDALNVDQQKTLGNLEDFINNHLDQVVERETRWILEFKPDVICTDAAYAPLVVAKALGIYSCMITNFSFDAIFSPLESSQLYMNYIQKTIEMYKNANLLIRLPGFINFPSFKDRNNHIIDVPLVVRKSRMDPIKVKQILKIPIDTKVVLVTFGGHELGKLGSDWSTDKVLPNDWVGVVISPGKQASLPIPKNDPLVNRFNFVNSKDWYMPDLINASDVVISKCGYGMCSETVAHSKPLIYVPRTGFSEEKGLLENLMFKFGCAIELSQLKFYKGEWINEIQSAFQLKNQSKIPLNGDFVASQVVITTTLLKSSKDQLC